MAEYEVALQEFLNEFLTPNRRQRIAEVLDQRIASLALMLFDVYQSHNASAVLRSCDAFGVQDVYVVEQEKEFSPNRDIARGSDRWLTIQRDSGPGAMERSLASLDQNGFRLVAMVPESSGSQTVASLPVEENLVLAFGTEKTGLPEEIIERAEYRAYLPMYGFVESCNVSVAAALAMQELGAKVRNSRQEWQICSERKRKLMLDWTKKSIPNVAAIEKRFRSSWKQGALD
ncbi:tRNA (guanosine(18)-2'-O)-methyltransferase [Thalassoglobus neptunius]|uniref:tRNA (guanosine(18)-2'-O)-methyltransferase n=1 Tax=Thalassoglobus neptunius TaxID=1938619 RepID=A0A5C5W9X7_9PLAN|nr:RNA methyltransferase [Thalassoglobus neptunius]TWT47093.1 tRNA (guanosine(18)-2'-O)-methyltransferase [Thalassoglobus neptunius]